MKYPLVSVLLIAGLSLLLGCSFFWESDVSERVKIADAITQEVAKKICKEKDLELAGTGGGAMYGVRMLSLSFYYYKEVDLETARKLIVYCVDEYLAAINSNKKIRPYLVNYPFTEQNIEIRLFICGPDRRALPIGKISNASAIDGTLEYEAKSNEKYKSSTLHQETYQQAKKLVAGDALKPVVETQQKEKTDA